MTDSNYAPDQENIDNLPIKEDDTEMEPLEEDEDEE